MTFRLNHFFLIVAGAALVATGMFGCMCRSKSKAQAQEAFLAGEQSAFDRMSAAQRTGIVVIGPVQNPQVPWTNGLTLSQAILAATYTGHTNPRQIILTRQGESAQLDPKVLLQGGDVPLQPGDTITVQE